MKKSFCLIASLTCLSLAAALPAAKVWAADSATSKPGAVKAQPLRLLAPVGLLDAAGQAIKADSLQQNANWVLVVLDATLPSAVQYLNQLQGKDLVHDQRTTILLIGTAAQTQALRSAYGALGAVRWVGSESNSVVKQLGLPTTPVMVGMRADQSMAWQFSGLPGTSEKAASMIRGWLRLDPGNEKAVSR